jgi:hypothetical protein
MVWGTRVAKDGKVRDRVGMSYGEVSCVILRGGADILQ